MRPVERGDAPLDHDGKPVLFRHYRDARDMLIQRIGDFCSYCEVALHSAVAVEHVSPKSLHPSSEREWSNFLLACDYCNPIKADRDVAVGDYFWPDQDNTARLFQYELDQAPKVGHGLTEAQHAIASRTLELTGLDRVPGHPRFSGRDRRWLKRNEVWGIALQAFKLLQANDTLEMRSLICLTAISRGGWSIWMTVFAQDIDMRSRFVNGFRGTAHNCFDAETRPILRAGGRI
ncbi:MAG: hypothetical protein WD278_18515 [Pirellulales bacterium]